MEAKAYRLHFTAMLTLLTGTTFAAEPGPTPPAADHSGSFASDEDRLDGDHLKLRVNVTGFESFDSDASDKKFCAPKGSKLQVTKQTQDYISVYFKSVPTHATAKAKPGLMASGEAATTAAVNACDGDKLVNDYTQYKITPQALSDHATRRTGVMFGALIVPFKFYMGSDSKLSASSTIAPYIGFRGPAPYGLTFTPVVSAGLGLVPVADATTGESSTKSAFSTAIGVRLTHSKNEKFNAGFLIGRDFLSKSDQGSDKSVDNTWFSLYVGYSM
jgi:hypothetical protein